MKLYRIDPKARTVEELDYDGTLEGMMQYYPYNLMCVDVSRFSMETIDGIVHLDSDTTNRNGEAIAMEEGAWGFNCGKCDRIHTIIGKALIAGRRSVDEEHCEPCEPSMTLEEVKKWVKWANVEKMTISEAMKLFMTGGKQVESIGEGEFIPVKAMVDAELELARIATKH